MKKIFSLIVIFSFSILLLGCGEERLDHRSILDNETDTVLSLGDEKAVFDDILGERALVESRFETDFEGVQYTYLNENIRVFFRDGIAVQIIVYDELADRFEFRDMSFNMTAQEVERNFTSHFGRDLLIHSQRFYDANGQNIESHDEAYYIAEAVLSELTHVPSALRIRSQHLMFPE